MIQKLKRFEIKNATRILGGEEQEPVDPTVQHQIDLQNRIHEMMRETRINRVKSADKIHNKITQYISS
ncbi:hypothetical protein [Kordia sp.]|uniref:hypothetical protein n=1 Tax=Kordia sp. TaxID=1965332 RepID=UPI0025C3FE34|nr:hypothetical protein [Kordia sp.]MCH2195421.1 hypothetical protein [Kordia sp.]